MYLKTCKYCTFSKLLPEDVMSMYIIFHSKPNQKYSEVYTLCVTVCMMAL